MLSLKDLVLPPDWDLIAGADTGTFMSALVVAIAPDPFGAFVIAEFPNYRYVGSGDAELVGLSLSEWAAGVTDTWLALTAGRLTIKPWVDANTQFGPELAHHGIFVRRNTRGAEVRTEICREYFQHDRIHLAPWLTILPYELEHARWPDDVSASGQYRRLKERDHTLDCLEHALSRRPRSRRFLGQRPKTFAEQWLETHRINLPRRRDVHLGAR